jgi:hypothetical protein
VKYEAWVNTKQKRAIPGRAFAGGADEPTAGRLETRLYLLSCVTSRLPGHDPGRTGVATTTHPTLWPGGWLQRAAIIFLPFAHRRKKLRRVPAAAFARHREAQNGCAARAAGRRNPAGAVLPTLAALWVPLAPACPSPDLTPAALRVRYFFFWRRGHAQAS